MMLEPRRNGQSSSLGGIKVCIKALPLSTQNPH